MKLINLGIILIIGLLLAEKCSLAMEFDDWDQDAGMDAQMEFEDLGGDGLVAGMDDDQSELINNTSLDNNSSGNNSSGNASAYLDEGKDAKNVQVAKDAKEAKDAKVEQEPSADVEMEKEGK